MKALILTAGQGKRLRPITDRIPKAMVSVNGRPLLYNTLDNLYDIGGITEIGIVVGYMADYIKSHVGDNYKGIPVKYFENKRYAETNNVVSLYTAAEFCDDEMLLLECDVFCKKEVLELLKNSDAECAILVSPFNKATMNGTVIETEGDIAKSLVLGAWQGPEFDYSNAEKTVNMYKFSREFVEYKYMPLLKWYVENMSEQSYYEKVLGSLLYLRECDARAVSVPESMWCEIDDEADLKRAEEQFGE